MMQELELDRFFNAEESTEMISICTFLTKAFWIRKMVRFTAVGLVAIVMCSLAELTILGHGHGPRSNGQSTQEGAWSFEVVSIKPDHSGTGLTPPPNPDPARWLSKSTAKMLVTFAFNLRDYQVSGEPEWAESERFLVEAKVDEPTAEQLRRLPREQQIDRMRLMIQTMLAERFKLAVRRETRELPAFLLTIGKGGPKFVEPAPLDPSQQAAGSSQVPPGRAGQPLVPPPGTE